MNQPNLIVTQAAGYTFGQVQPFLRSLKQTGFNGSVVFFVLESDRELRQRLERSGVTVVAYRNDYPYFVESQYHNYLTLANDGRAWPPASLRFFLYEAWLLAQGRLYERVLHTDVRDVIFQRDPFQVTWPSGMHAFLENRRLTIGNEPSNTIWIKACFGELALQQVASKPIACSGVILGQSAAWLAFLDVFNRTMIRCDNPTVGLDQGIFNGLLYLDSELLENEHMSSLEFTVWDDAQWLVSTESYFKPVRFIRWSTDAKVLNTSNQPVAIIHQYDRSAFMCLIWNRRILLSMLSQRPVYAIKNLILNIICWLQCSSQSSKIEG
jgi:hypothetical protein